MDRKARTFYDNFYRKREGERCVYCGDIAEHWDHVPPLAAIVKVDMRNLPYMKLELLPVCVECNVRLGAYPYRSIKKRKERIAYLKVKGLEDYLRKQELAKRYRKEQDFNMKQEQDKSNKRLQKLREEDIKYIKLYIKRNSKR